MAATSTGIGLFPAVGLVLVVLKLCHVISWPWLWVTVPFWGPIAVVLAVMLLLLLLVVAVALISA